MNLRATYRLQFGPDFGFADAARLGGPEGDAKIEEASKAITRLVRS